MAVVMAIVMMQYVHFRKFVFIVLVDDFVIIYVKIKIE